MDADEILTVMRWAMAFTILTCAAIPAAGSDHPDEVEALGKYLVAHGYGVVKVDVDDRNKEMLPVKINGKEVTLQIDTGAVRTVLSAGRAQDIGLDVHSTNLTGYGVGGAMQGHAGVAVVKSFTINDYEINRLNIVTVLPEGADLSHSDGLFGFDYLKANAVLLPVGARIILFKPGAGTAPPIDPFMNELGFRPIPLTFAKGGLHVEGHLNGHPLNALVDCGAALSTFDISFVARTAGIISSYVGSLKMVGVDGHQGATFVFTPKTLDFGSFVIKPTELTACAMPERDRQGYDALLGYDLLAAHQAIIDLGHDTLWMK